jgi:hypothetical protein
VHLKPILVNLLNQNVRAKSVREEVHMGGGNRARVQPVVKTKGSRGAIANLDHSDCAVSQKVIVNYFPEVRRGGGRRFSEDRVIMDNLVPLGNMGTSKEFIDELKKETLVLKFKILEA